MQLGDTGDVGSVPVLGRSPGGGNGLSLQYSCLEGESPGRRNLVGYSWWGRKKSDTTERLHFTRGHYLDSLWHITFIEVCFCDQIPIHLCGCLDCLVRRCGSSFSKQNYTYTCTHTHVLYIYHVKFFRFSVNLFYHELRKVT